MPRHLLPRREAGSRRTNWIADHRRLDDFRNLAFRNLTRARMLKLATGQQMLALMRSRAHGHRADGATPRSGSTLLREAEANRGRLAGVGGRILAETFHRAMEGSQVSIMADPTWRPTLGPDPQTTRMVDLLLFAAGGRAEVINRLGG